MALVALLTAIVILAAVVRHAPRPRAAEALARDDLEAAVAAGATGGSAAELVPAVKNRLSHRGLALAELRLRLRQELANRRQRGE